MSHEVHFGYGDKIVTYGTYGQRPAIFVKPVKVGIGVVGDLSDENEPFVADEFEDGEWVMTFPTEKQMDDMFTVLTGRQRTQAMEGLPNPPVSVDNNL